MLMKSFRPFLTFLLVFCPAVLLMAGCDSSDPVDDDPIVVNPAAGTYAFNTFAFDPDADVLPTLNLLDTLVTSETRLQLFDGGDFVLAYRYKQGSTYAIFGSYVVSQREVRLRATEGRSDEKRFADLLFAGAELVLKRSPAGTDLSTDTRRIVNLGTLSDRYKGIPPVEGTLQLDLEPLR